MNKREILMKRQSSDLLVQNPWNIVQFKVIVSIIIILKDKTSKYHLNKVHLIHNENFAK